MVTNPLLRIEFIKVVNTKILVRLVVVKHEIDGYEEAVLTAPMARFFPRRPARRWYWDLK